MSDCDGAPIARNDDSDLRDPFMDGMLWFFGSELVFWVGLGALFLLFGNRLT